MPARDEGAGTRTLRAGGDGLVAEVSDVQRARMLMAMAEVACERGLANATVAHVVARSGVSRRTFYEHFVGREECFLATFEEAVRKIVARVAPAYGRHSSWREGIRAALHELLSFLDEEPSMGDVVVVQAFGAGPLVLELRQRALSQAIAAVDRGREGLSGAAEPPPLTAEGVVGAVSAIVHARFLEADRPPLVGLTNQLTSLIMLPYLGAAAARQELQRPQPTAIHPAAAPDNRFGMLRDLEMRLTYRTMCVLLAIGSHPGASNRKVADFSGVGDQGQISKLLIRLQNLGLVRNRSNKQVKGEPNAWVLTERGASVRKAISVQSSAS
jgi:AcrR family transcriptional regulator